MLSPIANRNCTEVDNHHTHTHTHTRNVINIRTNTLLLKSNKGKVMWSVKPHM
jgi:hypothetical protein